MASSAKEGSSDKLCFFKAIGQAGGDFKAVYDLHMRIEALSKALYLYYMYDIFNIIPGKTLDTLEKKLQDVF